MLIIILSVNYARADWQYTRWGMTVEEVVSAPKGTLKRCVPSTCAGQETENDIAMLFGDYRSDGFLFTIFSLFDRTTGKLSSISLKLKDARQVYGLASALRAKYGAPAIADGTPGLLESWTWRPGSDQISLIAIGSHPPSDASLTYQPRVTPSNRRLFPRL